MTSPAIHLAAHLRLPPFLSRPPIERPLPRGWPTWLPLPANRPDDAALRVGQPADDAIVSEPAAPLVIESMLPSSAALGGWYDSSLDLKLGLQVEDLGPVEWLDEWDGAFASTN